MKKMVLFNSISQRGEIIEYLRKKLIDFYKAMTSALKINKDKSNKNF